MSKKSDWKSIGFCYVDSGSMMLADPCYVLSTEGAISGLHYQELTKIMEEKGWGKDYYVIRDGEGIVVPSGFGDGKYEVFVKTIDTDSFGKRVAEMKIVFINEGQEE